MRLRVSFFGQYINTSSKPTLKIKDLCSYVFNCIFGFAKVTFKDDTKKFAGY